MKQAPNRISIFRRKGAGVFRFACAVLLIPSLHAELFSAAYAWPSPCGSSLFEKEVLMTRPGFFLLRSQSHASFIRKIFPAMRSFGGFIAGRGFAWGYAD